MVVLKNPRAYVGRCYDAEAAQIFFTAIQNPSR